MKYEKGLEFNKLRVGTLVEDVPVNHPVFQEHEGYIAIRRYKKKWLDRIADMNEHFNNKKIPPSYYCLNCDRLEDGAHRFDLAKNYLKHKTRGVKTGSICYKKIRANMYNMFESRMYKMGVDPKDYKWLKAAENSKWHHFNKLDYYNKKILDVGCQTGYLLFKAVAKGAKYAEGYDTRDSVLKVGNKLADLLKLKKKIKLINADFRKSSIKENKFDIVLCLGLLHYFDKSEYENVLDKLLMVSKDKLIIEIRCTNSEKKELISRKQTLATIGWVKSWVKKNNVKIEKQIKRDSDRWLFVFDVKHKPIMLKKKDVEREMRKILEPPPHNQTIIPEDRELIPENEDKHFCHEDGHYTGDE